MTPRQLLAVWKRTNGHCHFCGDALNFEKRGRRRQQADGCWDVDHVIQLQKGGAAVVENCLPACSACNGLRWHRTGAAIRELLLLGQVAKSEIARRTTIGKRLVDKAPRSLLLTEVHGAARKKLIQFLRRDLQRSFSAAELNRRTAVPKVWVKRLLETSYQVDVIRGGGRYRFKGRPPKKRT